MPFDPVISFYGIQPYKNYLKGRQKYAGMFTAALIKIQKNKRKKLQYGIW